MSNVNRVVIVGRLTRDPELRSTPAGTPVCGLRIATNSRRRDPSGEWNEKPNFFDVSVWGAQGENCAAYLAKGRQVAIDGRLDWHEWEDSEGNRRQKVEIVADRVEFIGGGGGDAPPALPRDGLEPVGVAADADGDDIPF